MRAPVSRLLSLSSCPRKPESARGIYVLMRRSGWTAMGV